MAARRASAARAATDSSIAVVAPSELTMSATRAPGARLAASGARSSPALRMPAEMRSSICRPQTCCTPAAFLKRAPRMLGTQALGGGLFTFLARPCTPAVLHTRLHACVCGISHGPCLSGRDKPGGSLLGERRQATKSRGACTVQLEGAPTSPCHMSGQQAVNSHTQRSHTPSAPCDWKPRWNCETCKASYAHTQLLYT